MAEHDCPVLVTEAHKIAEVAKSKSADFKTIAGSFPPNSKKAGIKLIAAFSATKRPVSTLPVKQIKSTSSIKAAPVCDPPSTKFKTSLNWGILFTVVIKGATKRGVISLGLTITAQPANKAGIVSMVDKDKGKFQGLITPTRG